MSYANNKGADQPAHPRSLISAFFFYCLDSIISLDAIAEISRLWLAVAAQAGLCLAWSKTPEDTFCRVVAHLQVQLFGLYSMPKLKCLWLTVTVMSNRFRSNRKLKSQIT